MITRHDYISGKVSHGDYYKQLADSCGIGGFSQEFLIQVKKALDKGDTALNSIPLWKWDMMSLNDAANTHFTTALKQHGELNSLSTSLCMRKEKAIFEARTRLNLDSEKQI